ncbi:hypothetical protein Cgig2_027714 [Carnegiea gigantea]|uniref:Tyrosinase copper-binding domain-containing protein n=1 Tax=Carnegiea gigantea TaxID=171969 RepID=A0A9Q1JNS3_9CARY|nr:hypothetical protein Cgig2_032781 [Carnegiea gigantea]KAJ8428985.1 hypothetical protein Cgig2_027714 [Carnegiea gigantea]
MASLSPTASTPTLVTSALGASNPLFPKASQLPTPRGQTHPLNKPKLSCNATKNDGHGPNKSVNKEYSTSNYKLDRRNMLIGLGGLYGAATTLGSHPATFAAPIATPELGSCELPTDLPPGVPTFNCCPPKAKIVDFKPPSIPNPLRVRPAAHLVDEKYVEKFSKAIALMKALPPSDPRNFTQQANVHCAYCNGAYSQVGFPNLDLQVHTSWFFFPFHRWYLYFFERILGKLIDDPTFAMPFWNWDNPAGMQMPAIYANSNSPLYDPLRNASHRPPALLDLNYDTGVETELTDDELITVNLTTMYRQMVSNAKNARLFLGQPYRLGDRANPGAGSIENVPHNILHDWCGDPTQPNRENMGSFYSSAHRMWSIWKTLGGKRRDFTDRDWLDASFIFFDENARAVRVKVRDCLDERKLGYGYQNVDIPWLKRRPTPRRSRVATVFSSPPMAAKATTGSSSGTTFPKSLTSVIKTEVNRPMKSRSTSQKEDEEEVLVIELELEKDKFVKFDVYINDEDEIPSKKNRLKSEYAGSYVHIPHVHRHGGKNKKVKNSFRVGLTDLIEDLGADNDDALMVKLVPRAGEDAVVITNVKIEFAS